MNGVLSIGLSVSYEHAHEMDLSIFKRLYITNSVDRNRWTDVMIEPGALLEGRIFYASVFPDLVRVQNRYSFRLSLLDDDIRRSPIEPLWADFSMHAVASMLQNRAASNVSFVLPGPTEHYSVKAVVSANRAMLMCNPYLLNIIDQVAQNQAARADVSEALADMLDMVMNLDDTSRTVTAAANETEGDDNGGDDGDDDDDDDWAMEDDDYKAPPSEDESDEGSGSFHSEDCYDDAHTILSKYKPMCIPVSVTPIDQLPSRSPYAPPHHSTSEFTVDSDCSLSTLCVVLWFAYTGHIERWVDPARFLITTYDTVPQQDPTTTSGQMLNIRRWDQLARCPFLLPRASWEDIYVCATRFGFILLQDHCEGIIMKTMDPCSAARLLFRTWGRGAGFARVQGRALDILAWDPIMPYRGEASYDQIVNEIKKRRGLLERDGRMRG
ncbi:hypothetical protein BGZ54_008644 [Gamsiella multidivaricata]|nr:hypothetical protein BGZ54_008644 [Gamsiella multidivaricata]